MSHNAIEYDQQKKRFVFDGIPVRVSTLGRLLAQAIMEKAGYIDFEDGRPHISFDGYPSNWTTAVSVSYVQKMLEFTSRHGWFWDGLGLDGDHFFDNTSPTPGYSWGLAQELFGQARELYGKAKALFRDAHSRLATPRERRIWHRQARQMKQQARARWEQAWHCMSHRG